MARKMTHGSLFSGIGGFDLAAEWMGWENIFHCEYNPFGQKVLKHYFPNAISYEDITKTDFSIHRGTIDILTGGFPCQPYSTAGNRLGKADERHLFPEMLRCIREIKPRWIIGENVRGLVSWNGGMVFHEVYDDLEREGYEVLSFLIPAAGVNAPHRRDRIFFIAHSNNSSTEYTIQARRDLSSSKNESRITSDTESKGLEGQHRKWKRCSEYRTNKGIFIRSENKFNASNTYGIGLWGESNRIGKSRFIDQKSKTNYWQNFPTVSPICNGDDGFSNRLDNITFPKWRNESIKAGGNAIVPQVAYQIFKTIQQYENNTQNK